MNEAIKLNNRGFTIENKQLDINKSFNQRMHFLEFSCGAGASTFKALKEYVWGGGSSAGTATFKIHLPTGAVTTTGTINATGGVISGDLTVTGSLLSDDGSTFQTKLALGRVSFLKDGAEKAFIKTASDSSSLQCATGSLFYVTNIIGVPLLQIDQSSNLAFSTNSKISWAGGRSILADNSNMTADGNWLVLGGVRATSYTRREGSTDYSGDSGTFTDGSGNTVRVRGGIITDLSE